MHQNKSDLVDYQWIRIYSCGCSSSSNNNKNKKQHKQYRGESIRNNTTMSIPLQHSKMLDEATLEIVAQMYEPYTYENSDYLMTTKNNKTWISISYTYKYTPV